MKKAGNEEEQEVNSSTAVMDSHPSDVRTHSTWLVLVKKHCTCKLLSAFHPGQDSNLLETS